MTQGQDVSDGSRLAFPAVTLIGGGNMGGAILSGLLESGAAIDGPVRMTVRRERPADEAGDERVQVLSLERDPEANRRAVRGAGIVIVAVKPAMVAEVVAGFATDLDPDAVLVSVAAGVPLARLTAALGRDAAVARAMPNTPAVVGLGVTGLSVGTAVTESGRAHLRALFETVGAVVEVEEDRLDALTAVSGSGPAYVFFLIEQLTASAERLGFSPEEARLLVEETFRGAAELVAASGEAPAELRRRVTSPQGTTERGVAVLEAAGLGDLFDRVTGAALARAREIAASA